MGLVSGESGDYPSFKVWTWVVRVVPGQLTPPSNNSHLKNSPGTNHTLTMSPRQFQMFWWGELLGWGGGVIVIGEIFQEGDKDLSRWELSG